MKKRIFYHFSLIANIDQNELAQIFTNENEKIIEDKKGNIHISKYKETNLLCPPEKGTPIMFRCGQWKLNWFEVKNHSIDETNNTIIVNIILIAKNVRSYDSLFLTAKMLSDWDDKINK